AASLRDRLRRPLTEPACRQVLQLSGSGEGPGTGQGAVADGRRMSAAPGAYADEAAAAALNHMDSARSAWEDRTPGRASEGGADMETFAVTVVPVAKPDEWRAWVDSIASGDRADAHRQMMRRLGIKREHIRHQASPAGDVMVLVWEGVEQDRAPGLLADLVQNPQSEHERY